MKILKVILIIILIGAIGFAGWQGYLYFKDRQDRNKSNELQLIETLKANQGIIIKLKTDLADVQKKVVGETLKETVVVKETAPTYEEKKAEIIELKKDPIVNAEKIEVARVAFEERINEFQASPDKILINTGEEKIVIYEDTEGNLVSLESGVTITRHQDVKEVIQDLKVTKPKDYGIKAGAYYSFDGTYGIIISKELVTIKDYNLNASLLINSLKDYKLIAGADISYSIKDNLEIGIGYDTEKEFYTKLQYSF